MSYLHKNLASGRWKKFSLMEQMANIGAEVGRAINWKNKDENLAKSAFYRALELFELTVTDPKNRKRLKEINRSKEMFGDWFLGINQYQSSAEDWERYFLQFNLAVRLNK
ncbi:MAG: hypothetical protein V1810_01670 [Candidatus Beckwithbacteria bacterium]